MGAKVTRWPYLTAGVVMMLFAGIIYAWSILKAPLMEEFGWNSAELGLNFTITLSSFCVGNVLGGILIDKFSPRILTLVSGIMVCMGFIVSSTIQGQINILYLSYGVLCGLGIGVAYNLIISTVTRWYPDKRVTASGVMMMGFGASTLFLGSAAGFMLSAIGWRATYFVLGISILIVFVIGSIFMKKPDENIELPMPKEIKGTEEIKDYTSAEMIRRSSFWKFFVYSILVIAIGQVVISFAKDVAMVAGAGESLAILLVGVLSICNGLGRIVTGFLSDMIGTRKTMFIAVTLTVIAPIIMLLSVMSSSVTLVIVGLCAIGLAFGTLPPITTSYMSNFYGLKNFPLNFGIVGIATIPASFAATISGAMVNATGSYIYVFIMLIVFAVIAFGINLSIKKA